MDGINREPREGDSYCVSNDQTYSMLEHDGVDTSALIRFGTYIHQAAKKPTRQGF